MDGAVAALVGARTAHVRLESGHHGSLWLDLDGLFWEPAAVEPLAAALAGRVERHRPQAVVGPLVGGALLGQRVAARLGVPSAHAERAAHDPSALYSARYAIPAVLRQRLSGLRVAVVDDVVNAGSAVRSTVHAVQEAGGEVVAVAALLRLGSTALPWARDAGLPLEALSVRPNELWEPAGCPLCAAGEPLQDPASAPG